MTVFSMVFAISRVVVVFSMLVVTVEARAKRGVKGLSSTLSDSPSAAPSRYIAPKMKIGHTGNPAPLVTWIPSDMPSFAPSSSPSTKALSASDAPSFVPSPMPSCHQGKRSNAKGSKGKPKMTKGVKKSGADIETKGSKRKGDAKSEEKTGKSRKQLECQDEDDLDDQNSNAGQQYVAGAALSSQQTAAQQNNSQNSGASLKTKFEAVLTAAIVVTVLIF